MAKTKGIRKTKNGKYQVTFDHGMVDGKRHKPTKTFDTFDEANKALTAFQYNKQRNSLVTSNNMSVVDMLDYWMKHYVKKKCEATTKYGYNNIICKHINPYFKDLELSKLQPMHIQKYYDYLVEEKGLSPNTVYKHHACIRKALQFGLTHRLVHFNAASTVELPKKEQFEGKAYNSEQMTELLQKVTGTKLEIPVYLAGQLGLRREEISGLKWKNIDLEQGTINIVEVRTSAGKEVITKQPKTKESRRSLSMPNDLVEVLRKHREKQEYFKNLLGNEYVDLDYVYAKDNGEPYRVNSVTEQFNKFLKDNKLTKIRFHDLRHSLASILYDKKADIKAIADWLGHSNISTTTKIYTHRFDTTHQKTALLISEALSTKNSCTV